MNVALVSLLALATATFGDGEKDNDPNNVRQVPRPGVEVPTDQRSALQEGLAALRRQIDGLEADPDPWVQSLIPDIEIFHRAVLCALKYDEFFSPRDIRKAFDLLETGTERARQLANGSAPWTAKTGLQVFGYVSKIDKTVQPYGLVIPDTYQFAGRVKHRCDLWFHGRGETLSEVNFIDQRMKQIGRYAPDATIVVHPYGRYSNAFKFAGEIDVLEALEDVKRRFRIDEDRISVRGFSMGGAACWQFAVHYADRWFAANPGAGFSETPEFLRFFQKETLKPTPYEKALWQWYDCPGYAANLVHCPTIAYSGELDIQKQAADIMQPAIEAEGMQMTHIIGPQTKHTIHPDAMIEIEGRMNSLAEVGRNRFPNPLRFTTYTLRYHRMHWIDVQSLQEHWKKATVRAEWIGNRIDLKTTNIDCLVINFPPGRAPFQPGKVDVAINGYLLQGGTVQSDGSFRYPIYYDDHSWHDGQMTNTQVRKWPGLTGPIDDAFMDSFIFVEPTGESQSAVFAKWRKSEQAHAIRQWRQHFRGDAIVKKDVDITNDDIRDSNLVLWGDPQSNSILKRVEKKLPIRWDDGSIRVGNKKYSSDYHALVMVYPNPLNPNRYIVLNSGFTYREYAYLNNARQVPMLPDWAVVNLRTPPGSQFPGKVVDADFFNERWRLKPE